MFKLAHAGFDSLYVAFQGALPTETLEILKKARDKAAETQTEALVHIGPGKVAMHVAGHGLTGGYAYVCKTGPLGEQWMFKANSSPQEWNIFVKPYATALLAMGYHAMKDHLFSRLEAMGCRITGHSINRVDFAMDFLTREFEPRLDQFVSHARRKVMPTWSEEQAVPVTRPSSILGGRRLETVTVGKMPGLQVCVYDKRREAIDRRKLHWFDAWGIERNDPSHQVWRVEIRAAKNELTGRWRIKTFEDLENAIGDVMLNALEQIRYVDDHQTDSNVTRQSLHPLWIAAKEVVSGNLADYRSGLTPDQILEITRAEAERQYQSLVLGNVAGLAVVLGMDDETMETDLPELIRQRVAGAVGREDGRFAKTVRKARTRLHFVAPEPARDAP